jgi:hypothetical protein
MIVYLGTDETRRSSSWKVFAAHRGKLTQQIGNAPVLTYLLRGLSPQANYTDRATAVCQRS